MSLKIDSGSAELLRLLADRGPMTRAEVGETSGWARVTVNSRIDQLVSAGLIREQDSTVGSRGRPATRFAFHPERGHLLIADIGATAMRLAKCDLSGVILEMTNLATDIGRGPEQVLEEVLEGFRGLVGDEGVAQTWGIGVSVPGPVEFASGTVVDPPIMTGWDGFGLEGWIRERFGVAAFVDNDVNAMAWGERSAVRPGVDDMFYLKVGTGVGCGIVANGRMVRGSVGAAGDLGHTWADLLDQRTDRPLCRCGKLGCVEAYAGGWAIARDLAAATGSPKTVADVVEALKTGDPQAVNLVRQAGRILGAAVAQTMSLLNPTAVVVGGQVARAGEHLLAGLRELVARRSLPLTTRNFEIAVGILGDEAGVIGLAHGTAAKVLADSELISELLRRTPTARRQHGSKVRAAH